MASMAAETEKKGTKSKEDDTMLDGGCETSAGRTGSWPVGSSSPHERGRIIQSYL